MKNIITFLSLMLLSSSFVFAQSEAPARPVVIELFTSQGCSSCPPADAALRTMRDKEGIVALSWPVDYWDRLGWEDTLASPSYAKHQAAYNKRIGISGVFTPQVIIDGRFQCIGSKKDEVKLRVSEARATKRDDWSPDLMVADGSLQISLREASMPKTAAVRVVFFLRDTKVKIKDGENSGRTLHYSNVVRSSHIAGEWKGSAETLFIPLSKKLLNGADHAAVLIHEEYGHGPIIGASILSLGEN